MWRLYSRSRLAVRKSLSQRGATLSTFSRQVAVLAGASAFAQALSAVAAPFLTRLYRPDEFGTLAVFHSILTTAIVCSSLRYDFAVPLPISNRSATGLLSLAASIVLVVSVITIFPIMLAGDALAQMLHASQLRSYLWLLPLGILGGGLYQVGTSWAIRTRKYQTIAHTTVTQNMVMVGTQLVLAPVSSSALGLIVGDVIGRMVGAGRLARTALRSGRMQRSGMSMGVQRRMARIYVRYPLLSFPAALLNTIGLQLPILILAYATDSRTVGLFALTYRLLSTPLTLIGRSISQVFFGEASAEASVNIERTSVLFSKITSRLFMIAIAPAALLALVGPSLFAFAFGPTWREAGVYAQLLSPVLIAQFVLGPVAQVLNITNHLERQLSWDLFRLLGVTGAMMLGARVGGARGAIIGYSASLTVLYIILFALYRHALRQPVYVAPSPTR